MLFVNFDGTSRLPGARFGGDAFRKMIPASGQKHYIVQSYLRENCEVFAEIDSVVRHNDIRLVFGGEHSISYPLIKRQIEAGCKKVVIFDAHHDSYEFPELTHFSFVSKLLNNFDVDILIVGARYEMDKAHPRLKALENSNISAKELTRRILDFVGAEKYYLSLDLDVVDPQEWRQVSGPVEGGISISKLSQILRYILTEIDPVAIDVVEWNPLRGENFMSDLNPILKPILLWHSQLTKGI